MPATLTWLSNLPLEIDMVTELKESDEPIDLRRDQVVGEMNDDLKKLATLRIDTMYEAEVLKLQIGFGKKDKDPRFSRMIELQQKAEVLDRIFWTCVNDAFNLWDTPSIGIRQGFKVVKILHDRD